MDRIGFEETRKVSYLEIDNNSSMTPAALLSCLQEAAISHSDAVGYTVDYMQGQRRGWSVVNWHLQLYRMPHYGERITIQTWSNKLVHFQAERSFYLLSETGEKLLDGASRWIFMDLERRKPTDTPPDMAARYCTDQAPAIPQEKFRMPKTPEGELLCSRELTVTRRDTDTNGHANNVKYLEWVMDDIPDEIYVGMTLRDIRIVYRKECLRGDTVRVETYVKKETDGTAVQSFLYQGETVVAALITLWQ